MADQVYRETDGSSVLSTLNHALSLVGYRLIKDDIRDNVYPDTYGS